jgi:dUTP pyrophosphatase
MSNFINVSTNSVKNIECNESIIRDLIQMDIKGNLLDMREMNKSSNTDLNQTTLNDLTTTFRIAFNPEHQEFLESVYGSSVKPKQYKDDIGIDLYVPQDIIVEPFETKFINLGIRAEFQGSDNKFYGYQLYPRSSISKTKLRLANSVGIIDPNYRGYLIAAVDNISDKPQQIKKGERLFQLVFVQLMKPTNVEIITEDQLSSTERGSGGFGSTGK